MAIFTTPLRYAVYNNLQDLVIDLLSNKGYDVN